MFHSSTWVLEPSWEQLGLQPMCILSVNKKEYVRPRITQDPRGYSSKGLPQCSVIPNSLFTIYNHYGRNVFFYKYSIYLTGSISHYLPRLWMSLFCPIQFEPLDEQTGRTTKRLSFQAEKNRLPTFFPCLSFTGPDAFVKYSFFHASSFWVTCYLLKVTADQFAFFCVRTTRKHYFFLPAYCLKQQDFFFHLYLIND